MILPSGDLFLSLLVGKICMERAVSITKVVMISYDWTVTETDMESIKFRYRFCWYICQECNWMFDFSLIAPKCNA